MSLEFEAVGKVIACSFVLGGPPFQCFSYPVAHFLVYNEVSSCDDLELIVDHEIKRKLVKVS